MIRKIDKLGRVVIPKEWRRDMNVGEEETVYLKYNPFTKTVTIVKDTILGECAFCGYNVPAHLLKYKNGFLCKECYKELSEK